MCGILCLCLACSCRYADMMKPRLAFVGMGQSPSERAQLEARATPDRETEREGAGADPSLDGVDLEARDAFGYEQDWGDLRQARRKLRSVEVLLENGHILRAEAELEPLIGAGVYEEEVNELLAEIERRRIQSIIREGQDTMENTMIREVQEGLLRPDSYGETVYIAPDAEPDTIPVGDVERLINRRVSIHLQNAGIAELVQALKQYEDLNIIADQSVAAAQQLTIDVDDVPLSDILAYISRNMGIGFSVGKNTLWITPAQPAGQPLETHVYRLQSGIVPPMARQNLADPNVAKSMALAEVPDTDLQDVLTTFVATPATQPAWKIYPQRNLLVVRDRRDRLRMVEDLLDRIDREPSQISIEARFITVRERELYKLGLDIQRFLVPASGTKAGFGDIAGTDTVTVQTVSGNTTTTPVSRPGQMSDALSYKRLEAVGSFPGEMTLSGVIGGQTFVAVMNALRQVSSSRTLTAESATVFNNRWATIQHGTKRYYYSSYDLQVIDQGDLGQGTQLVPDGQPTELALGYQLDVRANVGNDSETIMLALRPSISQFVGWDDFDAARLPIVDANSLSTSVVVKSGQTVVLGGTLTESVNKQMEKVPFLGDLPYIGGFFRNRSESDEPQHLLIFVTARVISKTGQYVEVLRSLGGMQEQ
jgi:type IV pilus assembly protein PilQ